MSLGNELFKIEEAYTSLGDAHYLGTGLHGQRVTTACPTLVSPEDTLWLETYYDVAEDAGAGVAGGEHGGDIQ